MDDAPKAFLPGFPALFSIVNPISGAFIFREATAARSPADRAAAAGEAGIYSLLIMMAAGVEDVLGPLLALQ